MARKPASKRPESGAGAPPADMAAQGAPVGLMAGQAPPEGGEAPSAMPPGQEMEEPTPEEQHYYEVVVANAMKAVYSGEVPEMIARSMEPGEGQYPVENLAGIVAPMMIAIEAQAAEAGDPVTREMTVQAALEIIEDIGTNLLPAAGMEALTEGEIEGVFLRAMQIIGADEQQAMAARMGPEGGPPPEQQPPPPAEGNGLMRGAPMGQGGPM